MPGTIRETRDVTVNKTNKNSRPHEAKALVGREMVNKRVNFTVYHVVRTMERRKWGMRPGGPGWPD